MALYFNNFNYDGRMQVGDFIKGDILWWLEHIPKASRPIKELDFSLTIFTDASTTGWGAVSDAGADIHGFWNKEQITHHINYLELLAIKLGLQSLAADLRGCRILLRVDNTTAISYINKMGGVRHAKYNMLARKIWQWAEERKITLFASYIKSEENVEADYLSRLTNPDTEWSLPDHDFEEISLKLGRPFIDLFASSNNKKCELFISRYPEKESVRTDAFTQSWSDVYAFPPFALVLRTLCKIQSDQATGILVVPNWPNQPWYPKFHQMLIEEPIYLNESNLFNHFANREIISINLIAGLVSGKYSRSATSQSKRSTLC